jgi:hypothetical protein
MVRIVYAFLMSPIHVTCCDMAMLTTEQYICHCETATSCSVTQEIHCILCNLKVCCHVLKGLTLVSTPRHKNPAENNGFSVLLHYE